MNLLLLSSDEVRDDQSVVINDRRANHLRGVLHVAPGHRVAAGVLNGELGTAIVREVGPDRVVLQLDLDAPPPRPEIVVILAMVRPQIMKRTLQHLSTLGVGHLALINSRRVEKSYFSQRLFDGDEYREHLVLGLEQARDTWVPEVTIHRRFRPFIEDVAPSLIEAAAHRIIAHPGRFPRATPLGSQRPVALAIGPEGGWIDDEVERFVDLGFTPVSLGPRILKVETALPVLYGALGL